jgi:Protein of unknown function (DUF3176)
LWGGEEKGPIHSLSDCHIQYTSQSWPLLAYISLSDIVFRPNRVNFPPFHSMSCCKAAHSRTVLSTFSMDGRTTDANAAHVNDQLMPWAWRARVDKSSKTQRDETWKSYRLAWTCFCTRFWDSWYPEIGALAFSLSCATATAVVLGCYNNKPTPELSLGITLNAIISILATASKVSLIYAISNALGQLKWVWFGRNRSLLDAEIFDNASRGPLGSLQMLSTRTWRSVASFGAILTLLALAFDPSVQQVVNYETRVHYSSADSSASIYQAHDFKIDSAAWRTSQAINSAFWRNEFILEPNCTSGNCLWPLFKTFAFCSECSDDTTWTLPDDCTLMTPPEKVLRSKDLKWGETLILLRNCTTTSTSGHSIDMTMELSVGVSTATKDNAYYSSRVSISQPIHRVSILSSIADFNAQNTLIMNASLNIPIIELGVLSMNIDKALKGQVRASRCTLDLCLNEYHLSTNSGQVVANLTSSQRVNKTIKILSKPVENESYLSKGSFLCVQPLNAPSANFSDMNVFQEDCPTCRVSGRADHKGFGFCSIYQMSTGLDPHGFLTDKAAFEKYLPGSINHTFAIRAQWNESSTHVISRDDLLNTFSAQNLSSSSNVESWHEIGPESVMNNLAASLTKLLLSPSTNPNGTTIFTGEVGSLITYVRVSWLWLILPYSLTLFGFIFLLITIYTTHKSSAPLWKSSINALLYHGLNHDTGIYPAMATMPDMDEQAAATRARLSAFGVYQRLMLETTVTRRESWESR